MQTIVEGRKARSFGLDIARAVAIGLVVASHTLPAVLGPVGKTAAEWGGRAGVELFFALSGFLIGSILIKTAAAGLGPRAVGVFLVRRWARTLPAYYLALLYAGWFFANQNPHAFLLLQNFFPGEPRVLPASWSLVMEEYFYFFFPLTMLLLTAVIGQGVRVVWVTALGLIAACWAGRGLIAAGVFHIGLNELHENPFIRMDCAAYGVVAALVLRAGPPAWLTRHRAAGLVLVSVVASLAWAGLFVAVVHASPEALAHAGFAGWGPAYLVLQWSPVAPVFTLAVMGLAALRPRRPQVLGPAVTAVSLWSYSLYLWHTMVIVWVEYYRIGEPGWGRVGLVVAGSLVVSALGYALVERPVLLLRDRLVRGPEPIVVAARPPAPAPGG